MRGTGKRYTEMAWHRPVFGVYKEKQFIVYGMNEPKNGLASVWGGDEAHQQDWTEVMEVPECHLGKPQGTTEDF